MKLTCKYHANKQISSIHNTKFLELMIDNSLSWKNYIDELICKLNKACYAIRSVAPLMSPEVLRMIYFSYVHTIISHGIIWGGGILLIAKLYLKFKKE